MCASHKKSKDPICKTPNEITNFYRIKHTLLLLSHVIKTHRCVLYICDWIWKNLASIHTISTYNFTRNGLLAQYTITFHCVPCSKVTSLVSVEAFLSPVWASSGALAPLDGHGSLVLVLGGLDKPRKTGQCLLSSIWSAVSTTKVR